MFLNLSLCIHTNPIFMLSHLQSCLSMKTNDTDRNECYGGGSRMASGFRPFKTVVQDGCQWMLELSCDLQPWVSCFQMRKQLMQKGLISYQSMS